MPDDLTQIEALTKRVAELEGENETLRIEADELGQVADLEDEVERLSFDSADDEVDITFIGRPASGPSTFPATC